MFHNLMNQLHIAGEKGYDIMVRDDVAEKLENLKLWRRAASRWLDVMQQLELTCAQREWVRHRRIKCLSCVKIPPVRTYLDIMRIAQAARVTQREMNISQDGGIAFRRRYPGK